MRPSRSRPTAELMSIQNGQPMSMADFTDRRAMKVTLVVAYSRSPEHERAATKWARHRFCS